MTFLDLTILMLVTYRLTRWLQLDSMLDNPRELLAGWLEITPQPWWRRRLLELIQCPFCESVWVAAGALGFWTLIGPYDLGWRFLLDWLAIAAGAMAVYRYIDPPE